MIADAIRERLGEDPADISAVMAGINALLDDSIAAEAFRIREKPDDSIGRRRGVIDISAIDFDALAKRFAKTGHKNTELERLKAAVRGQLDKLLHANRTEPTIWQSSRS